jgi:uroporphyrinogen-III synthase
VTPFVWHRAFERRHVLARTRALTRDIAFPTLLAMSLNGLAVVSFESRRVDEMKALLAATGARPIVVPSVREVLLEPGPDLMELAAKLRAREIDAVLFSSAVGARGLFEVAAPVLSAEALRAELAQVVLVTRGPKTHAALSGLGFSGVVTTGAPHTSDELVRAVAGSVGVSGKELAVIEAGMPQLELETALTSAGAQVLVVSVYRYALPSDTRDLVSAIASIVRGDASIVLFTNARQVDNVFALAREHGLPIEAALGRSVVAAIGDVTARRLASHGVEAAIVPGTSRMDALVREVAERAPALLAHARTASEVETRKR